MRNTQMFAGGVGTTAGGPVSRPSEVQVPIKYSSPHQEAWIYPGDYIVADLDGVVVLPASLVDQVLDVIPKIVGADEKCAEAINGGMSVQEAFKRFRG